MPYDGGKTIYPQQQPQGGSTPLVQLQQMPPVKQ